MAGQGEHIRFFTEGLLSKSGFDDGDLLDDLLYDVGVEYHRDDDHHLHNHHEILARVVERYIVPVVDIPKDAEVFRIGTCHNPIRLRDSREVYGTTLLSLEPAVVNVPVAAILSIAIEVECERRG